MNKLFLDTAFVISLLSTNDEYHQVAKRLAAELITQQIITSRAIMLEIGNALSKPSYRPQTIQFLQFLEADPQIKIVPLDESLYAQAFQLFSSRMDKSWGLVDCISFVIMKNNNIKMALTTDKHFQQAGFQALMLDK